MTIKTFDDALDFYPAPAHRRALSRFGGTLRTYWNAMRHGLAAARAYHEMTARGVPHETAVQHVFSDHFDAR
jgi:hypothetical protein